MGPGRRERPVEESTRGGMLPTLSKRETWGGGGEKVDRWNPDGAAPGTGVQKTSTWCERLRSNPQWLHKNH